MFYRVLVMILLIIVTSCSSQAVNNQADNEQWPANNNSYNQIHPSLQELRAKVGEVTQQNMLYNDFP